MTYFYKTLSALGAIATLSACGGGMDTAPLQAAPTGPLFEQGKVTPKTTLPSDERSMTGTMLRNGLIPTIGPVARGNGTAAKVAWDGSRLTLIDGTNSKTYDLDAGTGRSTLRSRAVFVNGNGDYAAYLNGEHSAVATFVETNQLAVKLGAISVGNITPDMAGAPATASYSGKLNGQFVAGSNTPYDTYANATLTTDFTNGSYAFSADAPVSRNAINGNFTNASGLVMSGAGTVSGASFAGTTLTQAGMSGTMSGNFYGPNAEEAGGTLDATGASGEFIGAFILSR